MIIERRFPLRTMMTWASRTIAWSSAWCTLVYYAYAGLELTFLRLPFLPIATVGTAVAFYVGFKNNAAYDRFWEGRKLWGGIVNASRGFATSTLAFVHGARDERDPDELASIHRELVYRHLAWVNALRLQLRKTSRFFDKPTPWTKRRMERHGPHMRNDWDAELRPFLSPEELAVVSAKQNPATHLLSNQAQALATLQREGRLDLFHQIALMEIVGKLYDLQGACERIKNTPFPRQYAEFSRIFVRVFVTLVPFGLLDVFAQHIADNEAKVGWLVSWLPVVPMIFASALVTWVFTAMEGIGDASEDPFERSMNDVPMNALSRGIEIDLRELLGETELPPREARIDNLMY